MACGTIPELDITASCDTLQTGYDGDLAWIFNPDNFTVTAAAGVATITTTSGVFTQVGGADNSVMLVSAPARTDMGMARYTHTANVAVLNYSAAVKDALYGIGSKRVGLIVKRNDGVYVLAGYGAISTNVVSAPLYVNITDDASANGGGLGLELVSKEGSEAISGPITLWSGALAFIEAHLPA